MKKLKSLSIILLAVVLIFTATACNTPEVKDNLWETATYTENQTVGTGSKNFNVEIEAGEKSIILTVNTEKEKLGEALYELGIINDASFFNVCNGIEASWEQDNAYWAFFVNGEMANYGVNDADLSEPATYKIAYTKI